MLIERLFYFGSGEQYQWVSPWTNCFFPGMLFYQSLAYLYPPVVSRLCKMTIFVSSVISENCSFNLLF